MKGQASRYAELGKIRSAVYFPLDTLFFPTPCVKWGQHLPHRDDMRLHSLTFAKCFEILGWEALQKCKGLNVIKRKQEVQQLEGIRSK